jgi:hypothetical protein
MESDLNRLYWVFWSMEAMGYNTKEPFKWEYCFCDLDITRLLSLKEELVNSISFDCDELICDEDNYWNLEVKKFEILTPEQLYQRNIDFEELAEKHSVYQYSGWGIEGMKL